MADSKKTTTTGGIKTPFTDAVSKKVGSKR
jgi:hypothetical protein